MAFTLILLRGLSSVRDGLISGCLFCRRQRSMTPPLDAENYENEKRISVQERIMQMQNKLEHTSPGQSSSDVMSPQQAKARWDGFPTVFIHTCWHRINIFMCSALQWVFHTLLQITVLNTPYIAENSKTPDQSFQGMLTKISGFKPEIYLVYSKRICPVDTRA